MPALLALALALLSLPAAADDDLGAAAKSAAMLGKAGSEEAKLLPEAKPSGTAIVMRDGREDGCAAVAREAQGDSAEYRVLWTPLIDEDGSDAPRRREMSMRMFRVASGSAAPDPKRFRFGRSCRLSRAARSPKLGGEDSSSVKRGAIYAMAYSATGSLGEGPLTRACAGLVVYWGMTEAEAFEACQKGSAGGP